MRLLLVLSFAGSVLFPQGPAQKAHVHGLAEVSIAMDGLKGAVEFEAPADGILGFETDAKTPAQKKTVATSLNTLRTRGAELVIFPTASGCKLTPKEVDVHREGASHAEVHALYDLVCAKAIEGEITFGVTKLFPNTREVNVTLIADQVQKSARIDGDTGSIRP